MSLLKKLEALQSEQTEFRKGLGLFSCITLVAGSMIGSGVFKVAASMLRTVPNPGIMLSVWVACGIITLMGAVSYAELAASMPKAGGPYVYLREAFGELWAFLYGWTLFFAIQTGTIAAVAVIFGQAGYSLFSSEHLFTTTVGEAWPVKILAVACLTFLTAWNIFGIKMGAAIQNLFTILKVGAIVVIVGAAFAHPAVPAGISIWPGKLISGSLLSSFGLAAVAAFWAYDAWFNVMFASEEIINVKRTLPLSLIIGTGIVMILYCLAQWSYVHVLPVAAIQGLQSQIVGIEASRVTLGAVGGIFITVALLCSTFGCVNGILLSGPRAYYAVGKDVSFFRKVSEIHPAYRTPVFALVVQLVWSIFLVLSGTYDQLFTYVEFTTFLFYALTAVGIFVLRRKYPELARPFKVPSIIPIAYFVLVVAFLLNTLWRQRVESLIGIGIVTLGAVVYFLLGSLKAKEQEPEKITT